MCLIFSSSLAHRLIMSSRRQINRCHEHRMRNKFVRSFECFSCVRVCESVVDQIRTMFPCFNETNIFLFPSNAIEAGLMNARHNRSLSDSISVCVCFFLLTAALLMLSLSEISEKQLPEDQLVEAR